MFGTVDTGKSWKSQVCPRAIGGITTCHKMRPSVSLPTITYICIGELRHFHHSPTTSFLHSQPIQTHPSGPGLVWTKCSFGMIPLSLHSVDYSPRAFHSSTHNVVRASCFEVLSASVESRKLFLDGSLCLAGRWPWSGCLGPSSWRQRSALAMEWVSRVIFLEAAICLGGNLSAYVETGYPRQCIQAGYWGSL